MVKIFGLTRAFNCSIWFLCLNSIAAVGSEWLLPLPNIFTPALKKGSRSDTLTLSLPLASIGYGQFRSKVFWVLGDFLGVDSGGRKRPRRWVRLSGI